jgi:ribosome biogenesis GTPase
MTLEDIGYTGNLEKYRQDQNLGDYDIGRVVSEHKERYIVRTIKGEFEAEITGNMRFTAKNREDFPAVGDWVAIKTDSVDFVIIYKILPRFSILKRQAVGQFGEIQIIATNIDYALIIQAVDRDFNVNRLERYLTICNAAGVNSIIILSKTDLIDESKLTQIVDIIKHRIKNVPIIAISNQTKQGFNNLSERIEKGKTYCLLGSSGVGKSTLINSLSGETLMKTDAISAASNKGKHFTSHRELIVLKRGGIVIDNPGMREVGIADVENGIDTTFDEIIMLSQQCKFEDCTHDNETGCAVRYALENGTLDVASFENYQKMEREKEHFESTIAEKRKKEKMFGKVLKDYYKKDVKQRKV